MQCLEFPITNTLLGGILSIFLSERFRNLARWTGRILSTPPTHSVNSGRNLVNLNTRQNLLSPYTYISVWANTQYSIRAEQNWLNCLTLGTDWDPSGPNKIPVFRWSLMRREKWSKRPWRTLETLLPWPAPPPTPCMEQQDKGRYHATIVPQYRHGTRSDLQLYNLDYNRSL